MVGCPYETESTLKETFDLIKEIRPGSSIHCSIFRPYPATKSYSLCRRKGWLSGRRFKGFFIDSQLDLPHLSRGVIIKYQRKIAALSEDFFSLVKDKTVDERPGIR